MSEHENHTPILLKNTYCVTEILLKEENYYLFIFIMVFSYIFVIMFYAVDTFLLSLKMELIVLLKFFSLDCLCGI